MSVREYPKRHVYFILDGQNISQTQKLTFLLIEINEGLSRFVADIIWNSKEARKMDFYQKIEFSKPSTLMHK